MKKNKCFWGHNYGKWSIYSDKKLVRTEDKEEVGHTVEQRRICEDCGYTEIKCEKIIKI